MSVEVGEIAPDFELPDQDRNPVRLSDFRGKKAVVLVFYPLAFSPICEGELCALRDEIPVFQSDRVETLTVSVDSVWTHKAWAEKENFKFRLLSDFWPHGKVAREYGVFDENLGVALRATFILDQDGRVRYKVVNPVTQARDKDEYKKVLQDMGLA